MEVSSTVERGLGPFANAVYKLGESTTPPRCADLPRPDGPNCAARRYGLNRSSLSMSSASMVPVEKIEEGFPQASGADLSEIPYSIDPEIWKRDCKLTCNCV